MKPKPSNHQISFWKRYTTATLVIMLALLTFPVRYASAAPHTMAAGDGQGTMSVSQTTVVYGTGKTFIFTFTAVNDTKDGDAINLIVPTGWTAPVDTSGPGLITITNVDCGAPLPSLGGITPSTDPLPPGYIIAIDTKNCANGQSFTVTYDGVTTAKVTLPGPQYTFLTQTDFSGGSATSLTAGSPIITVEPKPLTVTDGLIPTPASKVYDGTDIATLTIGAPVLSVSEKVGSDVVTLVTDAAVGKYSNKNVGANKTVNISGLSLTGADAGNYSVDAITRTASITAKPITVSAVTDSRIYNGTGSSSGAPNISPALAGADTPGFTQTFDNKNVGSGKTLTPAGIANDGNGGNNYTYTFTPNTTGIITTKPITVTAVIDSKTYNQTTSSSGDPNISPALVGTDTPSFTQTFNTPDAGAGNKTLTPAGKVIDGNFGNNYAYTLTPIYTGTISPKPITVTADAKSKIYGAPDPALTYAAPDLISGDALSGALIRAAGDDVGAYAISKNTLANPNYALSYVSANLNINKAPLTVRPHDQTIISGTADPIFTFYYSGFVSPDGIAPVDTLAVIDAAPTCGVSGAHIILKIYPIVCAGGSDNNYVFSFVKGALTVIERNTYPSSRGLDGWTLESSRYSNTASTLSASGKLRAGDDARDRQYRSLLYFNTSSLPEKAIVVKATLKIYKSGFTSTTDPFTTHGNLVADIKKGFFGLSPLELGDFNAAAEPANLGKFRDIGGGWHQLTLSSVNFKYINVFGVTQFRIRFTKGDNNDKTANIALFDSGSDANPPQLIIEYTAP